jgi:hypothetical protein
LNDESSTDMWMGDCGRDAEDDEEAELEVDARFEVYEDEEVVPMAWPSEEGLEGTGQEGLEDHTSWNGADDEVLLCMTRSRSGRLGSGRVVILRRTVDLAQECFTSTRQRLGSIRRSTGAWLDVRT